MPHFVGSLSRRVFGFSGLNLNRMAYVSYRCVHNAEDEQQRVNLSLQVFLAMMSNAILPMGMRPPFSFPQDYVSEDHFIVFDCGAGESGDSSCASAVESQKPE